MTKCIVWDLDNTLWHGTLADGDRLVLNGPAVTALKTAVERGVLNSIASRNDTRQAIDKLAVLGLVDYFIYPRIDPFIIKSAAVEEIAARFNLSLDQTAFVDDDPFERYEVTRYLPTVKVFAADRVHILTEEINALPNPTADRLLWMRNRETRLQAESTFTGTRAEFLQECHMSLIIRKALETDIPRVIELAGRARKINNLKTVLSSPSLNPSLPHEACTVDNQAVDFQAFLSDNHPDRCVYVCELSDRFGAYGVVGAGVFQTDGAVLTIDLFCISCRVEGRGTAAAFLNGALQSIIQDAPNLKTVRCRIENAREGTALMLFKSLGFTVTEKDGNAVTVSRSLPLQAAPVPWITVKNDSRKQSICGK